MYIPQTREEYLFYSSGVFALFAILLINMSLWFRDDAYPDIGNANEVARDWARQPLVDITVTRDESCPSGTEAIFFRPWLGTDIYCICDDIN